MGITRSLPFRQQNNVLSVGTRQCVRASRVSCFRCVHPAIYREIFVVSISCKSAPYKVNTWIISNLFVERQILELVDNALRALIRQNARRNKLKREV